MQLDRCNQAWKASERFGLTVQEGGYDRPTSGCLCSHTDHGMSHLCSMVTMPQPCHRHKGVAYQAVVAIVTIVTIVFMQCSFRPSRHFMPKRAATNRTNGNDGYDGNKPLIYQTFRCHSRLCHRNHGLCHQNGTPSSCGSSSRPTSLVASQRTSAATIHRVVP